MTDIILGLGKLFQWSFKLLPPIGEYMNWLLIFLGIGWFAYWCMKIYQYGSEDKAEN